MNKHALPSLSAPLGPYAIPLFLALLSRYLRRSKSKSILLAEHNAQLDRNLAMRAFLTGPMWVGWTRPKIMGVVRALERIPLVGMVGGVVEGYVPLVDDYFYCKSLSLLQSANGRYVLNRDTRSCTILSQRHACSAWSTMHGWTVDIWRCYNMTSGCFCR